MIEGPIPEISVLQEGVPVLGSLSDMDANTHQMHRGNILKACLEYLRTNERQLLGQIMSFGSEISSE